jgi:hypothetical protein
MPVTFHHTSNLVRHGSFASSGTPPRHCRRRLAGTCGAHGGSRWTVEGFWKISSFVNGADRPRGQCWRCTSHSLLRTTPNPTGKCQGEPGVSIVCGETPGSSTNLSLQWLYASSCSLHVCLAARFWLRILSLLLYNSQTRDCVETPMAEDDTATTPLV